MKTRSLLFLLLIILLICVPGTALANIDVRINGQEYSLDPPPVITEGRTFAPINLFKTLGAKVDWNQTSQTTFIKRDDVSIHIPIGSFYPKVNGRIEPVQIAAQIIDDNTYIPLHFAVTALGDKVKWDDTTGISITTRPEKESSQLIPLDIPEIGTFNSYQIADNVYVGPNLNMDLLYIAAVTGSRFTHPAFSNVSNPIDRAARGYFRRFIKHSDYATEIMELSYKTSSKLFPISISNEMFRLEQVLSEKNALNDVLNNTNYDLNGIVNTLQGFYNVTRAETFFKENRTLYNEMTDNFMKDITFNHVQRFEEFFGTDMSSHRFEIILSPIMRGGMASLLERHDGSITYRNKMNPSYRKAFVLEILYHETCHNFFSSIRRDNKELIEQYSSYADTLKDNAMVSNRLVFDRFLDETITRAVTVYMLEKHHSKQMAIENLQKELKRGWTSTDDIYFLIKNKYVNNRSQYPTFESFLPEILEMLKAKSTGLPYDVGPREEFSSKNLVVISSDLTYIITLKHLWRQKISLQVNEQEIDDLEIFKNALVIIAYFPGQDVISGIHEDLLGYNYNEIITATERGEEYFRVHQDNDRTVLIFGAKDNKSLDALMDGFDFEGYWYQ